MSKVRPGWHYSAARREVDGEVEWGVVEVYHVNGETDWSADFVEASGGESRDELGRQLHRMMTDIYMTQGYIDLDLGQSLSLEAEA